jgi:integrase
MALYRTEDGQQRSAGSYSSRKEAAKAGARAELLGTHIKQRPVISREIKGKGITVAAYAEDWIENHRLEPTTRVIYEMILRKYIRAKFGGRAMRDITPAEVRAWFRDLERQKKSGAVQAKIKTVAGAMFSAALDDELIAANPFTGLKTTPNPRPVMHILTRDEYRRLLEAIPEHYKLLIRFLVESGLRWGEAMAVEPGDFRGDTLVVQRCRDAHGNVKPYAKGGKVRQVQLSSSLADEVRERVPFLTPSGAMISTTNFRKWVWLPALKQTGITDFTPHDLRHCSASWLLQAGVDLVVVRDRLGHSNIAITSRYLHTLPDAQSKAVDALDEFLA